MVYWEGYLGTLELEWEPLLEWEPEPSPSSEVEVEKNPLGTPLRNLYMLCRTAAALCCCTELLLHPLVLQHIVRLLSETLVVRRNERATQGVSTNLALTLSSVATNCTLERANIVTTTRRTNYCIRRSQERKDAEGNNLFSLEKVITPKTEQESRPTTAAIPSSHPSPQKPA